MLLAELIVKKPILYIFLPYHYLHSKLFNCARVQMFLSKDIQSSFHYNSNIFNNNALFNQSSVYIIFYLVPTILIPTDHRKVEGGGTLHSILYITLCSFCFCFCKLRRLEQIFKMCWYRSMIGYVGLSGNIVYSPHYRHVVRMMNLISFYWTHCFV